MLTLCAEKQFDNIRADWVVTAAFQAFRAFQAAEIGDVRRFATVGTGSGTDVIAALDTFPQLMGVAMTDLHNDVVQVAKSNVLSATEKADERVREVATEAVAGSGDVLSPLKDQVPFDIIYELAHQVVHWYLRALTETEGIYRIFPSRTWVTYPVARLQQPMLEIAPRTRFRTSSPRLSWTFIMCACIKPKLSGCSVALAPSFQAWEEGSHWKRC